MIVRFGINAASVAEDLVRCASAFAFNTGLIRTAGFPACTAVVVVGEDVDFASVIDFAVAVAAIGRIERIVHAFELARTFDTSRRHVKRLVREALVSA